MLKLELWDHSKSQPRGGITVVEFGEVTPGNVFPIALYISNCIMIVQ